MASSRKMIIRIIIIFSRTCVAFETQFDITFNTFFFFNFLADTSKWVRLKWKGEGPSPRYSHSAAVGAAGMWVCGGLEGLQTKNDLWRWSFGKYQ